MGHPLGRAQVAIFSSVCTLPLLATLSFLFNRLRQPVERCAYARKAFAVFSTPIIPYYTRLTLKVCWRYRPGV